MANKYQVADEILTSEQGGPGEYNIIFTNLNITDSNNTESVEVISTITDYVKDHLDLDIEYDDIDGAPGIPEEGFNNDEIKDFHKVAFTGDYSDLENRIQVPEDTNGESAAYETVDNVRQLKPLNEIAFTGLTDLGNVQVSQVFDLRTYTLPESSGINIEDPTSNTYQLRHLGDESKVIKNFNIVDPNNNNAVGPLGTDIDSFANSLVNTNNKKPHFIVTEQGTFLVLNAERVLGNGDNVRYDKFDVVSRAEFDHQIIGNNATIEQLNAMLDSISSNVSCFIFDFTNSVIYCKINEIGEEIEIPQLATVATSGDYDDLSNTPILDASDSGTDITGLATVATTGNFDDLNNQYYIFTPGQFIYKYNSNNNNWNVLTGNQLTTMQSCGMVAQNTGTFSAWVKDIDQLYKEEDISTSNFIDELEELIRQFNAGKICYLASANSWKLITNIETHYGNNVLLNATIQCALYQINNFNNELISAAVNNDNNIDTIAENIVNSIWCSGITIDLNNKILYSTFERIFPIYTANAGIGITPHGSIGAYISSKAGNNLTIITTQGEEGLYVGNNS